MTKIKVFECGLCKLGNRVEMTRKQFRKHLAEEHRIFREKFNVKGEKQKRIKQKWVLEK